MQGLMWMIPVETVFVTVIPPRGEVLGMPPKPSVKPR